MDKKDTITVKTSDLYQLAYFVPLCSFFVYFSQRMVFGPSEISLPGVSVNEDMSIFFTDPSGKTFLQGLMFFFNSSINVSVIIISSSNTNYMKKTFYPMYYYTNKGGKYFNV